MKDSCYDQYTIKIVLRLILVSLYKITLAMRIKKSTLFIGTSRSGAIKNIDRKKRLTLCLCEEGIIYSVNMAIANSTLPSFPLFTLLVVRNTNKDF